MPLVQNLMPQGQDFFEPLGRLELTRIPTEALRGVTTPTLLQFPEDLEGPRLLGQPPRHTRLPHEELLEPVELPRIQLQAEPLQQDLPPANHGPLQNAGTVGEPRLDGSDDDSPGERLQVARVRPLSPLSLRPLSILNVLD